MLSNLIQKSLIYLDSIVSLCISFLSVNIDSSIVATDFDSSFLGLVEWENTLWEILSRSRFQEPNHCRYRACCRFAATVLWSFLRDLIWKTQRCFLLVIVHLIVDRCELRVWVETDLGLITCVWRPVCHSARLTSERSGSGNSARFQRWWKVQGRNWWCGPEWRECAFVDTQEWHDNEEWRWLFCANKTTHILSHAKCACVQCGTLTRKLCVMRASGEMCYSHDALCS